MNHSERKTGDLAGEALQDPSICVIEPTRGWRRFGFRELFENRDLFRFLVLRSIKVRYAQSILGVGWAVVQPLAQMVVFTVIFGIFMAVDSEGVPYPAFALAGLIPWTLFANSVTESTDSLVAQVNLVSKIYFPRLLMPLAAVASRSVDFVISFTLLMLLLLVYGISPTPGIVFLPLLIAILAIFASGTGILLSAFAIQYRDIRYAMSFGIQLFMYAAPVVYPASSVPPRFQALYALNPLVGVVEGFRSALLGTTPLRVDWILGGFVVSVVVFVIGVFVFRQKERVFADVV